MTEPKCNELLVRRAANGGWVISERFSDRVFAAVTDDIEALYELARLMGARVEISLVEPLAFKGQSYNPETKKDHYVRTIRVEQDGGE